jgi:hypothetical protein
MYIIKGDPFLIRFNMALITVAMQKQLHGSVRQNKPEAILNEEYKSVLL